MIKAKQQSNVVYYLLLLFSFFLPISPRLASLSIVFLTIYWLFIEQGFKFYLQLRASLPIAFIAFYLLHILSLFFTQDIAAGIFDLEVKLSLFIFPLVLFTSVYLTEKTYHHVLCTFIVSATIASSYCLIMASYTYFTEAENTFFYSKLTAPLSFHPSYFGLYIGFCFFVVGKYLKARWKYLNNYARTGLILLNFYFALFILLLSARMAILSFLIVVSILAIIWIIKSRQFVKGFFIFFFGILSLGIIVYSLPTTKMRLEIAYKNFHSKNEKEDVRLQVWKSAIELIQTQHYIGTGAGDVRQDLFNVYLKRNYEGPIRKRLNAHNQYLQTTAGLGLLGLFILIASLWLPFKKSIQQRQYLYSVFILFFALNILTESMLETQRGVLFYAFFNSLLARRLYPSLNHLKDELNIKK